MVKEDPFDLSVQCDIMSRINIKQFQAQLVSTPSTEQAGQTPSSLLRPSGAAPALQNNDLDQAARKFSQATANTTALGAPPARSLQASATPLDLSAYTSQQGDTFDSVAAQYGISAADLIAANPGVSFNIPAGTQLTIPDGSAGMGTTAASSTATASLADSGLSDSGDAGTDASNGIDTTDYGDFGSDAGTSQYGDYGTDAGTTAYGDSGTDAGTTDYGDAGTDAGSIGTDSGSLSGIGGGTQGGLLGTIETVLEHLFPGLASLLGAIGGGAAASGAGAGYGGITTIGSDPLGNDPITQAGGDGTSLDVVNRQASSLGAASTAPSATADENKPS